MKKSWGKVEEEFRKVEEKSGHKGIKEAIGSATPQIKPTVLRTIYETLNHF